MLNTYLVYKFAGVLKMLLNLFLKYVIIFPTHKNLINDFACRGFVASAGRCQQTLVCKSAK